ncbi:MAG: hypothetical protein V2J26_07505 [Pacificimonas sp.]|jgi:membrane-anchored glycerophosphoryl diester phosphodiesterase (GDPDase)|nr:hypothetical protein [Pacificimonas sp.]
MTLSLDQLWRDTQATMKARGADFVLPAAAFIFLPNVALALFVAQPESVAEAEPTYFLWNGLAGFVGLLATIAIITMALFPSLSVAAAIRRTGSLLVPAIVVGLLSAVAIGIGFLAFILPGLFVFGRLWLALPALVSGSSEGFIEPLRDSWTVTKGSVLRAVFLIVVVVAAAILLSIPVAVLSAVDMMVGFATVERQTLGLLGAIGTGLISSAVGTYYAVLQAEAFRQLTTDRRPPA